MPTAAPSAEPHATTTLLLDTWEQGRPADAFPVPSALRGAFAAVVAEAISGDHDINLDQADVQLVLDGATGLAVGRAGSSGPGRVQRALAEAWDGMQALDLYPVAEGRILLSILSREENDLDMDELTVITEALQQATGLEWEMIFGHGVVPNQAEEIYIGFLLAPRCTSDEMAQLRTRLVAALPAERDSKEQLETALARVGALKAAALAEGAYDEAAKHRCQEL